MIGLDSANHDKVASQESHGPAISCGSMPAVTTIVGAGRRRCFQPMATIGHRQDPVAGRIRSGGVGMIEKKPSEDRR